MVPREAAYTVRGGCTNQKRASGSVAVIELTGRGVRGHK